MNKSVLTFIFMAFSLNGMAQDTDAQLTRSYQHSAFALFNAVAQQETGNVCFSPLSVQMALSMVQNGAAGNTLSQLQQALGTTGFTNEEIGQFNAKLSKALTERPAELVQIIEEEAEWEGLDPQDMCDSYFSRCELANALWTRPNVHLYDTFVEALRTYYDAGVDAVWFDTWEGIDKINDWVNERTHSLIPKLYDEPQSEELAVVLMNALYFKGCWVKPFLLEDTDKGQFLLNDETYAKVDMMFSRDRFDCAITPSFRTITLYYGAEWDFSMTLFVPLEGTALPPLTLDDWAAAMKPKYLHINLYMPRFEIEGRYDLIEVLKNLGVTDAFDDRKADFMKMCEVNRAIGQIYQLSKIIINEEGTEASALTVIEMSDGIDLTKPEDYQDFKVDRPFYFTIQSRKANTILFVGRVTQLAGELGQIDGVKRPTPDPSRDGGEKAGAVYDLNGRKVNLITSPYPVGEGRTLTRGIFIIDGRKVVVK